MNRRDFLKGASAAAIAAAAPAVALPIDKPSDPAIRYALSAIEWLRRNDETYQQALDQLMASGRAMVLQPNDGSPARLIPEHITGASVDLCWYEETATLSQTAIDALNDMAKQFKNE